MTVPLVSNTKESTYITLVSMIRKIYFDLDKFDVKFKRNHNYFYDVIMIVSVSCIIIMQLR